LGRQLHNHESMVKKKRGSKTIKNAPMAVVLARRQRTGPLKHSDDPEGQQPSKLNLLQSLCGDPQRGPVISKGSLFDRQGAMFEVSRS